MTKRLLENGTVMTGPKGAVAAGVPAERSAVLALIASAFVWGVIWFPYRVLRDAGVDGVLAVSLTYGTALVLGGLVFRRKLVGLRPSWPLFWLALSAGGCNLGYVLAALNGEIVRVLLLFYLAPLWTVVLARLLLGERLTRSGVFVVALALAGAVIMLWQPAIGWPVPINLADWLGLGAGFSFALFNVLSRAIGAVSIEVKSLCAFAGVVLLGTLLISLGVSQPRLPGAAPIWLLIFLLGLVLVVINLVVQFGLSRVEANRAIVIMISELGFAAISSWLLADETLDARDCLGGAMIVVATLLAAYRAKA